MAKNQSAPFVIPLRHDGEYILQTHEDVEWTELESLFNEYHISHPFLCIQPESHLEIVFARSCARARLPIIVGTTYNLQLSLRMYGLTTPDCIVSHPDVIPFLLESPVVTKEIEQLKLLVLIGASTKPSPTQPERIPQVAIRTIAHPFLKQHD